MSSKILIEKNVLYREISAFNTHFGLFVFTQVIFLDLFECDVSRLRGRRRLREIHSVKERLLLLFAKRVPDLSQ